MFNPYRSAFVAVALSGALAGTARADVQPALTTTAIVQAALSVNQTATGTQAQKEFTIPPSVRRQLVALEATGNAPSADADMVMWNAGSPGRTAAVKRDDQIDRFAAGIVNRTSAIARNLTRSAMRFLGTPYVFGGTTAAGFDCSGYVQHVFAMLGIALPRTADAQYYAGKPTRGGMRAGDLVFFQTYCPGPSHVGIYLGGGKFISSSGRGVSVSHLSDGYWKSRYIGAKRFN